MSMLSMHIRACKQHDYIACTRVAMKNGAETPASPAPLTDRPLTMQSAYLISYNAYECLWIL